MRAGNSERSCAVRLDIIQRGIARGHIPWPASAERRLRIAHAAWQPGRIAATRAAASARGQLLRSDHAVEQLRQGGIRGFSLVDHFSASFDVVQQSNGVTSTVRPQPRLASWREESDLAQIFLRLLQFGFLGFVASRKLRELGLISSAGALASMAFCEIFSFRAGGGPNPRRRFCPP